MRLEKNPTIIEGNHRRATFLVAIPTFGLVPIEFVVGFSRMQIPMNCLCESLIVKGMEIGVARNYIAEQALKMSSRPEYILFIGDDMLLSWNSLLLLYEEMKTDRWDVLSGLYYMKAEPPVPVMNRKGNEGSMIEGKHFKNGEVIQVDLCGLDFTLVRSDIFEKMGKAPWFKTGPTMEDNGAISSFTEDVYFCDKALENNFKLGVHTGVRLGHLYYKTGEVF